MSRKRKKEEKATAGKKKVKVDSVIEVKPKKGKKVEVKIEP